MSTLKTKLPTDTWVTATWEEYLQEIAQPEYAKAKCYYYKGQMRIEMSPVGNAHASDHSIIIYAVHLFASLKGIDLNGKDNCTYRKTGCNEIQPDASFYIGKNAELIPWGTTIIDLDVYPAPDLVIEVASTSLSDDKGEKRLLYEELGVKEYWILDVENVKILAFAIENGGSRKITESQVLPGLVMAVLEAAFDQSRKTNHGQVGAWLLAEFQQD